MTRVFFERNISGVFGFKLASLGGEGSEVEGFVECLNKHLLNRTYTAFRIYSCIQIEGVRMANCGERGDFFLVSFYGILRLKAYICFFVSMRDRF